MLIEYFHKNPRWDKETVDKAAKKSGLSRAQVYKWGWDRKKKADPEEEGFVRLAKDEFGGYSKHDFIDDNDPIAELLDIDLTEQIRELGFNVRKDKERRSEPKTDSKLLKRTNLVDTKRRDLKMRHKEISCSVNEAENLYTNKSKTLLKNAGVQTPDIRKLSPDDFITPIKSSRLLNLEGNRNLQKLKQTLFSDSSEKEPLSASKSERKLTPSSENSLLKKSKSGINTSDLK